MEYMAWDANLYLGHDTSVRHLCVEKAKTSALEDETEFCRSGSAFTETSSLGLLPLNRMISLIFLC